ncbi:MAG: MoaD/ThiS family protein [Epsilonproteobacteria bacterium]|nr:MoaD/ThiS family protein [Campylobacterota bacterium]
MTITFNAFSFVREKLKKNGITDFINAKVEVPEGCDVNYLIQNMMGLKDEDVEAVFLNGKVVPKTSIMRDGDRVALVPPGTPGSYRLTLGMKKRD